MNPTIYLAHLGETHFVLSPPLHLDDCKGRGLLLPQHTIIPRVMFSKP